MDLESMGLPFNVEGLLGQVVAYGMRISGVLFLFWVGAKVGKRVEAAVAARLTATQLDKTVAMFLGTLARWTLLVAVVIAGLGMLGVETTSFAAVLASAGLAVGLALQGTLANFASGVLLLILRPFRVGDTVSAGGSVGTVVEIGLFATVIDTADNRRIYVPNKSIAGANIENTSHHPKRRVDVAVRVDPAIDVARAREVIDEALRGLTGRDAELGHSVALAGVGAAGTDFQARVWCDRASVPSVQEASLEAVRKALEKAEIGLR